MTSLNKDCLKIILSKLPVEQRYRAQQVCKQFQAASRAQLGITENKEKCEKLSSNRSKYKKELENTLNQIEDQYRRLYAPKLSSDIYQMRCMCKIVDQFNSWYHGIGGETSVDPKVVLGDVSRIRYVKLYRHRDTCATPDPYIGEGCNCPVKQMSLAFSLNDKPGTRYTSSYCIDRHRPWDGYAKDAIASDYSDVDGTMQINWSTSGHILEHVVMRVLKAEIAIRESHSENVRDLDESEDYDHDWSEDEQLPFFQIIAQQPNVEDEDEDFPEGSKVFVIFALSDGSFTRVEIDTSSGINAVQKILRKIINDLPDIEEMSCKAYIPVNEKFDEYTKLHENHADQIDFSYYLQNTDYLHKYLYIYPAGYPELELTHGRIEFLKVLWSEKTEFELI